MARWDQSTFFGSIPELAALSTEERRCWAVAAEARSTVRDLGAHLNTLAATAVFLVVCFTAFALVGLVVIVGIELKPEGDGRGLSLTIALMGAAAVIGSFILTTGSYRRLRVVDGRSVMLEHLHQRRPTCVGCNDDLSGAGELPARPGVVRCPECGYINPRAVAEADGRP